MNNQGTLPFSGGDNIWGTVNAVTRLEVLMSTVLRTITTIFGELFIHATTFFYGKVSFEDDVYLQKAYFENKAYFKEEVQFQNKVDFTEDVHFTALPTCAVAPTTPADLVNYQYITDSTAGIGRYLLNKNNEWSGTNEFKKSVSINPDNLITTFHMGHNDHPLEEITAISRVITLTGLGSIESEPGEALSLGSGVVIKAASNIEISAGGAIELNATGNVEIGAAAVEIEAATITLLGTVISASIEGQIAALETEIAGDFAETNAAIAAVASDLLVTNTALAATDATLTALVVDVNLNIHSANGNGKVDTNQLTIWSKRFDEATMQNYHCIIQMSEHHNILHINNSITSHSCNALQLSTDNDITIDRDCYSDFFFGRTENHGINLGRRHDGATCTVDLFNQATFYDNAPLCSIAPEVGNHLCNKTYVDTAISGSSSSLLSSPNAWVGNTNTFNNYLPTSTLTATTANQLCNLTTCNGLISTLKGAGNTWTGSNAFTSGALTFNTSLNSITPTVFSYLSGVSSDLQTQLNTKAPLANPSFTGYITASGAATFGGRVTAYTGGIVTPQTGVIIEASNTNTQDTTINGTIAGEAVYNQIQMGLRAFVFAQGVNSSNNYIGSQGAGGNDPDFEYTFKRSVGLKIAPTGFDTSDFTDALRVIGAASITGSLSSAAFTCTSFTNGAVTNTELNTLSGVTGSVQNQLNGKGSLATSNAWLGTTNSFNSFLPTSTITATTADQFCNRSTVQSLVTAGHTTLLNTDNAWTKTNTYNFYIPTTTITATTSNQLCNLTTCNGLITTLKEGDNTWAGSNAFTSGALSFSTSLNSISPTTFAYLLNVSSDIQTQLNSKGTLAISNTWIGSSNIFSNGTTGNVLAPTASDNLLIGNNVVSGQIKIGANTTAELEIGRNVVGPGRITMTATTLKLGEYSGAILIGNTSETPAYQTLSINCPAQFYEIPTAPTPDPTSNSGEVATTAFTKTYGSNNFVTLATDQVISGIKTIAQKLIVDNIESSSTNLYIGRTVSNATIYIGDSSHSTSPIIEGSQALLRSRCNFPDPNPEVSSIFIHMKDTTIQLNCDRVTFNEIQETKQEHLDFPPTFSAVNYKNLEISHAGTYIRNISGITMFSGTPSSSTSIALYYSCPDCQNLFNQVTINENGTTVVQNPAIPGTAAQGCWKPYDVLGIDNFYTVQPGWGLVVYSSFNYTGTVLVNYANNTKNPVCLTPRKNTYGDVIVDDNASIKIFFNGIEITMTV